MRPLFQPERARTTLPCMGWLILLVLLAGCDRNEVKVYRVAKEEAALPSMPQNLPSGHPDVSPASQAPLTWTLPAGWEQQTPGEMRVASFNIKGADGKQADVSIVPLEGGAGGDAANVNRWRGQVNLPSLPEPELKKIAQTVEVDGQTADLYDLSGQKPDQGSPLRILGAIQHRAGTSWFFKMTGDDEIVAQHKSAFVSFLKSIQFQTADTATLSLPQPSMENGNLPAGHPDIPGAAPVSSAPTDGGRPDWQVPAGWREISAGQFLVAKFSIAGEDGAAAAVNVSRSAGDGGGLAANINRWRNQLSLAPATTGEMEKLSTPVDLVFPGTTATNKAMFVDMSGTDARSGAPVRLIGAMIPLADETWFYKLMGNHKIVEQQKKAFNRFVETVKY